jgi:hypothetical protein
MQHKRTEPPKHPVELPALWKVLLFHPRTVGFVLSGAAISAIAVAMQAPLLHNHQQPKDSSAPALGLSVRAIIIDPATQAITLEVIDSN